MSFSARLQATVLSELINWQSDKLVVGLVAPVATVGQLGIGSQFADGGRVLSGAALSPIQSSFAPCAQHAEHPEAVQLGEASFQADIVARAGRERERRLDG